MGSWEPLGAFDTLGLAENAAAGSIYRLNSDGEGIKAYIP